MAAVEIDTNSGFCNGVVTAIRKAEEELAKSGQLYCLGDIVHNSTEVERLRAKGLVTITHSDLHNLHNVKVLLRAHGEPPSTYEIARRNNIEIIDATCPVVLKLQQRIKQTFDSAPAQGGTQIVIYGKTGHAEVNGLVGQTDGRAIVVESQSDLDRIDPSLPVALYSQTTKSIEGFNAIREAIARRLANPASLSSYDTICRQVSNRVGRLTGFAANHQLVLFVSDQKSSNGKVLYAHCLEVNPATHFITGPNEINPSWITPEVKSIGICGATSTPRWLMEEVADKLTQLIDVDNNA